MRKIQPDQPDPKPDNVMCADCGVMNGHKETCKYFAKAEQDRKTSKPTIKAAFQILQIELRHKKANNEPYLVLDVVDPSNHNGKLYVWHQSLHQYLKGQVDKPILCEISEQKKGNSTYFQMEHLLEINGQQFVDNKPAVQGELLPQATEADEDF